MRTHTCRCLAPVLDEIGVHGESGFIRYSPKEHQLTAPVVIPGRETTVRLDLVRQTAAISVRTTGIWDPIVTLRKAPGPHLVDTRMNWPRSHLEVVHGRHRLPAVLHLRSGIYLWYVLRAERRIGAMLLIASAVSFFGNRICYQLLKRGSSLEKACPRMVKIPETVGNSGAEGVGPFKGADCRWFGAPHVRDCSRTPTDV